MLANSWYIGLINMAQFFKKYFPDINYVCRDYGIIN